MESQISIKYYIKLRFDVDLTLAGPLLHPLPHNYPIESFYVHKLNYTIVTYPNLSCDFFGDMITRG